MPWCESEIWAGFTRSEPWLPLPAQHKALSVDVQFPDPDSTLSFFREAIRLRKSSDALRKGDQRFLDADAGLLVFERRSAGLSALCAFNLTDREVRWRPPRMGCADRELSVGCESTAGTCPDSLPPGSGYVGVFPATDGAE